MNMHVSFAPKSSSTKRKITGRPDPIFEKIAAHRVAMQAYEDSCGYEDNFPDEIARATQQARDAATAFRRAEAAEKRTYKSLLSTMPTTAAGAAALAMHVAKNEAVWLEDMEENACFITLKTLAQFVEHPNMRGASSVDQLVSVKMEMDCLEARLRDIEGKDGDDIDATYRESEKDQLADRIYILRDYISAIEATSLVGAAIQVEVLAILQDQIANSIFSECDEKANNLRCKRLLYSISSAVRKALPGTTARKIDERDEHLNPWYRYEKCLEIIGRRHR